MISQDELKTHLKYDPDSGVFTWLKLSKGKERLLGKQAGCFDGDGYIIIKLLGNPFRAHRLAFLYMNGEIPDVVDHINRYRADNTWDNLRSADVFINNRNKSPARNKEIQHTGVYQDKGRDNYRARIWVAGRNVNLGTFDTIEEAVAARKGAEQLMWNKEEVCGET